MERQVLACLEQIYSIVSFHIWEMHAGNCWDENQQNETMLSWFFNQSSERIISDYSR